MSGDRHADEWRGQPGHRQVSSAGERNRDPILQVLRRVLAGGELVLEVASGTGTHAAWFVQHLPEIRWQPTDPDLIAHQSIEGWRAHLGDPRLLSPVRLDVTGTWPELVADALFCANMIHIAPWRATPALFDGAARVLGPGCPLILYGPFHDGGPTSPSNASFDARLRARDPSWGIREQVEVGAQARAAGFVLDEVVSMPANNRTLVFRRS